MKFFIRAEQSDQLLFEAATSDAWKKETIGIIDYEVCSIEHQFGKYSHRIVAYRFPNKTGQKDIITDDANNYLFIITNDRKETEKFVIEFYNDRGNSERLFDIQNNDFNWKKMPFSFLEQNTVYLILMAICRDGLWDGGIAMCQKGLDKKNTRKKRGFSLLFLLSLTYLPV